jgi:hypothetical protein
LPILAHLIQQGCRQIFLRPEGCRENRVFTSIQFFQLAIEIKGFSSDASVSLDDIGNQFESFFSFVIFN